jgi:flagellar basal body-associated protein FliL
MTNFEWFLLIVVVIVVPLIVAVVVTLWTIDQANKRKRQNRADAQIGVKRKAALSPEEVEQRRAERARKQAEAEEGAAHDTVVPNVAADGGTVAVRPDDAMDEPPAR